MIIGILLASLGVLLLLRNLELIELPTTMWEIFYPMLLVIVGTYLIIFAQKGKNWKKKIVEKVTQRNSNGRQ